MADKHYHDDWAKAKSRELVKSMIQRTILQKKKPEEIKVLCFPGIDAREVHEVYLPLGILPENLYGLERERDIANALEEKKLGIHIIRNARGKPLSLEEYVEQERKTNFDVVSLDFIGSLTTTQIDTMKILREKQQPREFVVHCANLLRRDGSSMAQYVAGDAVTKFWNTKTEIEEKGPRSIAPLVSEFLKAQMKESLETFRSEGFDKDKKSEGYSPALRLGFGGARLGGMCIMLRYAYGDTLFEKHKNVLEEAFNQGKDNFPAEDRKMVSFFLDNLGATLQKKAELICRANRLPVEIGGFLAQAALVAAKGRFYLADPNHYERYSYISESGAPMIGDIYLAHRPDEMITAARVLAPMLGFPTSIPLRDAQKMTRGYNDFVTSFRKFREYAFFELSKPLERIFLGNSSKPILTQQRFNESLKAGHSLEMIQEKYRGWTNKPLAQWESVYHGRPYEAQAPDGLVDDFLPKEDLIQMLQEGYPLEEIHAAWPSYSLESLRAYKANVTRGTYAKKEETTI